jgi:hypothetical protein
VSEYPGDAGHRRLQGKPELTQHENSVVGCGSRL